MLTTLTWRCKQQGVLALLQGWCVKSSDPRALGINSVPKEVIPGQVNSTNITICSPVSHPIGVACKGPCHTSSSHVTCTTCNCKVNQGNIDGHQTTVTLLWDLDGCVCLHGFMCYLASCMLSVLFPADFLSLVLSFAPLQFNSLRRNLKNHSGLSLKATFNVKQEVLRGFIHIFTNTFSLQFFMPSRGKFAWP